ncbi:MAG: substrate-binding domain-containing protein [bacterium]|nr:substrate-binding domain-containing protein [bacterium]
MRFSQRNLVIFVTLALILAACSGGSSGGNASSVTAPPLPNYMRATNESYPEFGGVARPNNAVDVFIAYSPETQQYMPRIIAAFNQASAAGTNPVTGQPWGGQPPVFVRGQQPTSGSSGAVAQGIVNAITAPNEANQYHPTIFQPSVSHWLEIVNVNAGQQVFDLAAAQPTALTPVVIGMWESRVQAIQATTGKTTISWDDLINVLESPNGWEDYGIFAGRRAVYYGHADPTNSSTGLSTTIAEYYACARRAGYTERRLSLDAVEDQAVRDCVSQIETLIRHYSASTEDFIEYIGRGPDFLDFLALEETDLICLNRGAQQGDRTCNRPRERLVAIYPEEGTFWHEHPFAIVNASWVTPEQQTAARIFTDFVLTPPMQQIIMSEGFRPANPSVPLDFPFVEENGVDPNQPTAILDVPSADALIGIQNSWTQVKKPADVLILVDVSGSMENEGRLDQARGAITAFVNAMSANNRIGLMTFSDRITVWQPLSNVESARPSILTYVNCQFGGGTVRTDVWLYGSCLQPGGSTSLYTAARTAIDALETISDPNRIRALLILSDGQDTCDSEGCSRLEDVISKIERTREDLNPVIVIPVAYGTDADTAALGEIARSSLTEVVSGSPENILDVLDSISSFF